ncbi:hypothetical protein DM47_3641 [Burkholderia mallei]|nr:hypothetical protein DM47_3641 [Burkholderia mallei]
MIEIEERGGLADLLEHARVAAAVRRIELDQVARREIVADHAVLAQRRERHALDHVRIARPERVLGR